MLELIQMIWNMFTTDGVMIFLGLVFIVSISSLVITVIKLFMPLSYYANCKEEPWSPWSKAAEALVSKNFEK